MHDALDQGVEQLAGAIERLRALITDLRPASLDQLGVGPALEALVERVASQSGLRISLRQDLAYEAGRAGSRHLPEVEATVYRVVQEALTNAVKHAEATSVEVTVRDADDATIEIVVRDDGRGFDTAAADTTAGFGLLGMRERVALVGGALDVTSSPGGTEVRASIPCRRRPVAADGAAATPTAARSS